MNRLLDGLRNGLVSFSLNRPRTVIAIAIVVTLAAASQLPRIQIDTDP